MRDTVRRVSKPFFDTTIRSREKVRFYHQKAVRRARKGFLKDLKAMRRAKKKKAVVYVKEPRAKVLHRTASRRVFISVARFAELTLTVHLARVFCRERNVRPCASAEREGPYTLTYTNFSLNTRSSFLKESVFFSLAFLKNLEATRFKGYMYIELASLKAIYESLGLFRVTTYRYNCAA